MWIQALNCLGEIRFAATVHFGDLLCAIQGLGSYQFLEADLKFISEFSCGGSFYKILGPNDLEFLKEIKFTFSIYLRFLAVYGKTRLCIKWKSVRICVEIHQTYQDFLAARNLLLKEHASQDLVYFRQGKQSLIVEPYAKSKTRTSTVFADIIIEGSSADAEDVSKDRPGSSRSIYGQEESEHDTRAE